MKKRYLSIITVLIIVMGIVLTGCKKEEDDDPKPDTKTVIIYGKNTDPPCIALKNDLDNEGIVYTFHDVFDSPAYNTEMRDKLEDAGLGNDPLVLPVADVKVNGTSHMKINADIDFIKSFF